MINCQRAVDFQCDRPSQSSDRLIIRGRYFEVYGEYPTADFVEKALTTCFQGGAVCNAADTDNNTRRYPVFKRPGAITIAIILANNKYDCGNGGGGDGGEGGVLDPLKCLSRPTFTGSGGSHPYGSQIVSIANMIVSHLDKGHWNYHNKPRPSMPDEYEYGSGGRKWKQELFDDPQTRDNNTVLQADAYSLYWCTWLTKDSYRGASVPGNSSIFATLAVRLQASAFATSGGGYDFVCNGPGIINGIAPGDVVFFYNNTFTHVGIVSSVSSSIVGTIESNSGRTTYDYTVADDGSVNNPNIIGFGRFR